MHKKNVFYYYLRRKIVIYNKYWSKIYVDIFIKNKKN